jgi:hypothetical protein
VASGAGADVVGPDPDMISSSEIAEVVRVLPRLRFKMAFKKLLTGHCLRQPGSQNGTWLDSYCRATATLIRYPKRLWLSIRPLSLSDSDCAPFAGGGVTV